MKIIAAARRVKVSAGGHGVVSHAGMGLLRELADLTGLSAQVTAVLADTYKGPWMYAPGAVFADLAPAGRTASTGSGSSVGIVSMRSEPRPRRRPCGDWSTSASTPRTCRRFVPPARWSHPPRNQVVPSPWQATPRRRRCCSQRKADEAAKSERFRCTTCATARIWSPLARTSGWAPISMRAI